MYSLGTQGTTKYSLKSVTLHFTLEDQKTGIITLRLAKDIVPTYPVQKEELSTADQYVYDDILKGYYLVFAVIKYDVDRNRLLNPHAPSAASISPILPFKFYH